MWQPSCARFVPCLQSIRGSTCWWRQSPSRRLPWVTLTPSLIVTLPTGRRGRRPLIPRRPIALPTGRSTTGRPLIPRRPVTLPTGCTAWVTRWRRDRLARERRRWCRVDRGVGGRGRRVGSGIVVVPTCPTRLLRRWLVITHNRPLSSRLAVSTPQHDARTWESRESLPGTCLDSRQQSGAGTSTASVIESPDGGTDIHRSG